MKKIIIILILGCFTFTGCQRLNLDPLIDASADNWFKNEDEFQQAINALYHPNMWYVEMNRIYNTDRHTDDWTERTVVYEVPAGTVSSDWGQLNTSWNNLYKGIARANTILSKINNRETRNISEAKLNQFKGEASFFRACFYSYLIFLWGDVPYVDKVLSIEEALNNGRIDKNEILQHIYQDLDVAIENLPLTSNGGTITKGAAYAFKARAAIWMLDYPTAKTAAEACMNLGVYTLDPDYSRLFLLGTNSSPEFIFAIPRSRRLTGEEINIRNWLPRNSHMRQVNF